MPYQDEKGHFTTRENDGGPCKHESPDDEPKQKKTIRGGKYLIGDREVTRDEWDAHDGPDEEMDATTDEDFEIEEKVAEKNGEAASDWDNDPDLEGTSYPNVKNYKGHSITSEMDGYTVNMDGDEAYFDTLNKAKAAIDGQNKEKPQEPKEEKKPSPAETKKAKTEEKARKLVSSRTDGQLVQLFDLTEIMPSNQETATVRGWIMDELKKRNPKAFDEWLESEEDSPSGFFGKGE